MAERSQFHVVTIGMDDVLVDGFYNRIAKRSDIKFTHFAHPKFTPDDWPDDLSKANVLFFRQSIDCDMPSPDEILLASLERDGVPTIHNMILGDRIVSRIGYEDAIRYTTFLAQRMIEEFLEIKPTIVIGAYDGVHGSLGFAVCKHLNIPWFCKHFSVIPPGLACFCDNLIPAKKVNLETNIGREEQLLRAEEFLLEFEDRKIQAPAFIAPNPLSFTGQIRKLPKRLVAISSTIKKGRRLKHLKYTEGVTNYSLSKAIQYFWRRSQARRALSRTELLIEPPSNRFVFFGLHMQPESTVDVWAPFYSNQIWVIELLARSIPPSHKLLVKIHKSDVSNYSRKQLNHICSLPGVEIVDPFADTQQFIREADLIVSIQGTIGLEGALHGKPVIMLGNSPNVIFETVTRIGSITDLPDLIRKKLGTPKSDRQKIIEDYANFMTPFMPACVNDWSIRKTDEEICGFVQLFEKLRIFVESNELTNPPS